MSKFKNKLCILMAVLVMITMTGTGVFAAEGLSQDADPQDVTVTEEEGMPAQAQGDEQGDVQMDAEDAEEPVEMMELIPISEATIAPIAPATYAGTPVMPKVTVTHNGTLLKENVDYNLAFSGNDAAGKATVTVYGKGNYTGQKQAFFIIKPAKIETVKAISGYKAIKLDWTESKGVDYYYIERYKGNSATPDRKHATTSKAVDPAGAVNQSYNAIEMRTTSWENAKKVDMGQAYTYKVWGVKNIDGTKYMSEPATVTGKCVDRLVIKVKMKRTIKKLKRGKTYKATGFGSGKFFITYKGRTYSVARVATKNRKAIYTKEGKYSKASVEFFMNGGETYAKGKNGSFVTVNKKKIATKKKKFIWVNTSNQRVYIVVKDNGRWVVKDDWKCSMGKADTPSPMGYKKIVKQRAHHPGHGAPYWNFISWNSKAQHGTALHGLESGWASKLGTLASHGCIRNPSEKAQWILNHCSIGTSVVIF